MTSFHYKPGYTSSTRTRVTPEMKAVAAEHFAAHYPNHGKIWAAIDLARLTDMAKDGKTPSEISKALGRTKRGILEKAKEHGLCRKILNNWANRPTSKGSPTFEDMARMLPSMWHEQIRELIRKRDENAQMNEDTSQRELNRHCQQLHDECLNGTGVPPRYYGVDTGFSSSSLAHVRQMQHMEQLILQQQLSANPPMFIVNEPADKIAHSIIMMKSRQPKDTMNTTYNKEMVIATGTKNLEAHKKVLADAAAFNRTQLEVYAAAVADTVGSGKTGGVDPVKLRFVNDETKTYDAYLVLMTHASDDKVPDCDEVRFLLRNPETMGNPREGKATLNLV